MSDVSAFAQSIVACAAPLVPDLGSELRFVRGTARESADLWLWGDGIAEICISISDGFPAVGILVDEYNFDQIPRSLVQDFVTALCDNRARVRLKKEFGVRSAILEVPVGSSVWEAKRVHDG